MRFSTYFILISYLIAGTGLLAVSLTNSLSMFVLVGIGCLILLSLLLNIYRKQLSISGSIWNNLALVIMVIGLADFLFISKSLIEVSIRFLTILMTAKLFDLKTNRDYTTLYILTFFQLLAACASTVNISFLIVLALYILIGIWTLTIFNLKKDWEENGTPNKEMSGSILGPYFFISISGLAIISFIITLSLFFIIPRMGVGFFNRESTDIIKVTGFSEDVDLSELGPIKLNQTIVMRVELPDYKTSAVRLHFRGISFDSYNGNRWQQTIKRTTPLKKDVNAIWNLPVIETRPTAEAIQLIQIILLEPIETNVLFSAVNVTGVSGNFTNVIADRAGSIYLSAPAYSRIEYTAYSILPNPSKAVLPVYDYTKDVSSKYLEISPGMERVFDLAKDITANEITPFEKATAIEEYLVSNFHYTLEPQKSGGRNPVEDFLFYSKEGYCEQYATAMAIMLRAAGIPSRLITGFLPGEWNNYGNYLIIRQRDAHSWVEAYLPESGWTTFDPTPSVEASGTILPSTSAITLFIDSLKWKWNRYIINYSFKDQVNFAKKVEKKTRSISSLISWNEIRSYISSTGILHKKTVVIVIAIIIFSLIVTILISLLWKSKKITKDSKVPTFYKNMLNILSKKGKIKKPVKTAREFANDVDIKEVRTLTDIYYNVRFGGIKLTDIENKRIEFCLSAIKKIR